MLKKLQGPNRRERMKPGTVRCRLWNCGDLGGNLVPCLAIAGVEGACQRDSKQKHMRLKEPGEETYPRACQHEHGCLVTRFLKQYHLLSGDKQTKTCFFPQTRILKFCLVMESTIRNKMSLLPREMSSGTERES